MFADCKKHTVVDIPADGPPNDTGYQPGNILYYIDRRVAREEIIFSHTSFRPFPQPSSLRHKLPFSYPLHAVQKYSPYEVHSCVFGNHLLIACGIMQSRNITESVANNQGSCLSAEVPANPHEYSCAIAPSPIKKCSSNVTVTQAYGPDNLAFYLCNQALFDTSNVFLEAMPIPNRSNFSMVAISDSEALIAGGCDSEHNTYFSDCYILSITTDTIKRIASLPRGLSSLSLASVNSRVIAFFGYSSTGPTSDIYEYDFVLNRWKQVIIDTRTAEVAFTVDNVVFTGMSSLSHTIRPCLPEMSQAASASVNPSISHSTPLSLNMQHPQNGLPPTGMQTQTNKESDRQKHGSTISSDVPLTQQKFVSLTTQDLQADVSLQQQQQQSQTTRPTTIFSSIRGKAAAILSTIASSAPQSNPVSSATLRFNTPNSEHSGSVPYPGPTDPLPLPSNLAVSDINMSKQEPSYRISLDLEPLGVSSVDSNLLRHELNASGLGLDMYPSTCGALVNSISPVSTDKIPPRADVGILSLFNRFVLLFGGRTDKHCLDDAYLFDSFTSGIVAVKFSGDSPSPRFGSILHYDGYCNIYIIGGRNFFAHYYDCYSITALKLFATGSLAMRECLLHNHIATATKGLSETFAAGNKRQIQIKNDLIAAVDAAQQYSKKLKKQRRQLDALEKTVEERQAKIAELEDTLVRRDKEYHGKVIEFQSRIAELEREISYRSAVVSKLDRRLEDADRQKDSLLMHSSSTTSENVALRQQMSALTEDISKGQAQLAAAQDNLLKSASSISELKAQVNQRDTHISVLDEKLTASISQNKTLTEKVEKLSIVEVQYCDLMDSIRSVDAQWRLVQAKLSERTKIPSVHTPPMRGKPVALKARKPIVK